MEDVNFLNLVKEYIRLLYLYLNKKEDPSFVIDKNKLSFFMRLSKHHSTTALLSRKEIRWANCVYLITRVTEMRIAASISDEVN